ncbi:hypothetical protein C0Q70_09491 [Pomacea canaliculata]|uniref:Uncharacterized protein n=1 Tax=Pomacea canaliculata TaxID=400727 RepID=A0A2T7P9Y9_POMCA|nr:hypothetical protein C0Q70_09491 [Pomacea canaliculata]
MESGVHRAGMCKTRRNKSDMRSLGEDVGDADTLLTGCWQLAAGCPMAADIMPLPPSQQQAVGAVGNCGRP